jgi:hypothetical protein
MTRHAEPVCHDLIWDVGLAMNSGDRGHYYGRRRWDTDAVAARAAPRGWPEFRSACPIADGLGSRGVQNREDGKGILT